MFIIERMIGIGCYLFFLFAVCILIIRSRYTLQQILKWYTLVLAFMGFLYKPYMTHDLYRLYEQMDLFGQQGFFASFREYVIMSTTPAARFMSLVIGRTGIYGLLPAIAVFITYYCIFYIVIKNAQIYKIKRIDSMLTVFFLMSTGSYMLAVSNVFTMLAMALVCFCFYRESVENKFSTWHIALYVTAMLLHNLGAIVVVLRIAIILFSGKIPKDKVKKYGVAIIAVGILLLLVPSLRDKIWGKVIDYLFGDSYSYFWEYLAGGVTLIIEIWCLFKANQGRLRREKRLKETKIFLTGCVLIACVLCMVFSFFHRFATYIAPILCAPLLMVVLRVENRAQSRQERRYPIRLAVFVICLINLLLVCTRGSLCSLKFFELG